MAIIRAISSSFTRHTTSPSQLMRLRRIAFILLTFSAIKVTSGINSNAEFTNHVIPHLNLPCRSNQDCSIISNSICSRQFQLCLTFGQLDWADEEFAHSSAYVDEPKMHPSVDNVEQIVEFGRLIEEYSRIANCAENDVRQWSCPMCSSAFTSGFQTLVTASSSQWDTFSYVGYNTKHKIIVVSFRGTHGIENGILDGMAWHQDAIQIPHCDGCTVESGFLLGYNTMANAILDAVELASVSLAGYRIMVTGYSLGGGMASIAAVELAASIDSPVELYTFAQVRVGNAAFVRRLEETISNRFRFTNKRDIVPHMPPAMLGFRHFGPEIWLQRSTPGEDNVYKICIDGEDPTCSKSNSILLLPSDHCSYLGEHICECNPSYKVTAVVSWADQLGMKSLRESKTQLYILSSVFVLTAIGYALSKAKNLCVKCVASAPRTIPNHHDFIPLESWNRV